MIKLRLIVAAGLVAPAVLIPSPAAAADVEVTSAAGAALAVPAADTAGAVTVCPSCEVRTPQEGLARLASGGTLRVKPGRYPGHLIVDRPAHLVGIGNPVLDAGGNGTVVRLRAAGSSIEGFTVQGSGTNHDREDTGISVEAARTTVRNNWLRDVLFGIYAKNADNSRIENNTVTGKNLTMADKGDGIKVWYSPSITVTGNTTHGVRDNLMWFSSGCTVSNNHLLDGRYAIHLMWSDNCHISGNVAEHNSVGAYVMYSVTLHLTGNTFRDNRTSTGLGIGLRDTDSVTLTDNVLVHNRMGLNLFNTPRTAGTVNRFSKNLVAYNDLGVSSESTSKGDIFTGNDFIENVQQVGGDDEQSLAGITWAKNGRGNYWSDYSGYDGDGDGVGDTAYAPRQTFENLVDANPDFALLSLSPAAKALDWAANAFPVFGSTTTINDPAPLTKPVTTAEAAKEDGVTLPLLAGAGALALIGGVLVLAIRRPGRPGKSAKRNRPEGGQAPDAGAAAVSVTGLRKAYRDVTIVDDLTFEVDAGEAVALWGDNGAGKTTVLRCLLGLVRHQGEARIGGWSSRRHPREALARCGHVSQEPAFHSDLTLTETLDFYGRLRGADRAEQQRVLKIVGLLDSASKQVSALSGGMRRKLAVAVALLGAPRVLLLDEPTANLDQRSRRDLIALLRELKASGIAMVLATHQADEVLALADRVLKLTAGRSATKVDLAAFAKGQAGGEQLALMVPEARRDDAARLLLDAGIPVGQAQADVEVTR